MTDRTSSAMSLGVSVSSVTAREIPPLHDSSCALTDRCSLHIYPLTNLEVARAKAVADWQEVLWGDLKLSEMFLGWQVILEEMTSLRLLQLANMFFANADLNGVDAVAFKCLHLGDLAAIELDDGAGDKSAPSVPEMRHAHLVANDTSTEARTTCRLT